MRIVRLLTLGAAVTLGATVAWWGVPLWRQASALRAIVADDEQQRARGWRHLMAAPPGSSPRAASLLGPINDRLLDAPDAALLDGAGVLSALHLWGWEHQPSGLVLRELVARSRQDDPAAWLDAARRMRDCPLDVEPARVREILAPLLLCSRSEVRLESMAAACAWAGPRRGEWLAGLPLAEGDVALRRRHLLALALTEAPMRLEVTRSAGLDETQCRQVAMDGTAEPALRRLAAWRWEGIERALVLEILAAEPADPDGSVFAAALLAERRMSRAESIALAESWIRDFNDDRKRAGALLAALLGAHQALLEEAYDLEDVPIVRTTQRLALHVLGRPVSEAGHGGEEVEFAYRALHTPEGDFRPDVALCLLMAGHRPATRLLASRQRGDWRLTVSQRAWLAERFVPQWTEALGRPIGGDRRALDLHFDELEVLADLTERRLEFDPESKTFRY